MFLHNICWVKHKYSLKCQHKSIEQFFFIKQNNYPVFIHVLICPAPVHLWTKLRSVGVVEKCTESQEQMSLTVKLMAFLFGHNKNDVYNHKVSHPCLWISFMIWVSLVVSFLFLQITLYGLWY